MKKKIVIIVILLAIALVLLFIPKSTYQKLFNKGDVDENNELSYSLLVYLEDDLNRVVGVNVKVNELEEDEVRQKWNLLTVNSNMLPANFQSSIPSNCELVDYKEEDNKLVLYTNAAIKDANGRKALESIAWTFINDDIKEVCIFVNDEQINCFKDYSFKKINKNQGINLEYETMYLYESTATTLIYQQDEYILPVTYFHLESDICDYIVMKTLDNLDFNTEVYDYQIEDSVLTLDFVDASMLSLNQITTLVESIGFNLNVDCLNINNNENIFYQRVFNEVEE
ncbi:MAG: GerMN domain-containing protein [Bacilli bacterium]|nr:GerMN domain-containing protein [Bacilli bacterium]